MKVLSVTCKQYDYEYPYRFGVNAHWYRDFATVKKTNEPQDLQLSLADRPDQAYDVFGFY